MHTESNRPTCNTGKPTVTNSGILREQKKTIPYQSMWQILKNVIGGEPIKVGYDIVWPIKSLNLEICTKPRPNPSHSSFVSGRPRY